MPVTARLSKAFYDRFGEQVTNELVEWFNQVDLTYRTDLRQLNETNFGRFDAKLEQRFAEFETRIDKRFGEIDVRFAELEGRIDKQDALLEARLSRQDGTLQRELQRQTRWMVGLWMTTMVTIFASVIAVLARI